MPKTSRSRSTTGRREQGIAHRAADQESAAARVAHAAIDPPRQVEERLVEGAEIDVHFA